eukprot:11534291-Alexandrium_andersonii.AAC.1
MASSSSFAPPVAGHAWEAPGYEASDSEDEMDPLEVAGSEFAKYLTGLYFEGKASARDVCTMAF